MIAVLYEPRYGSSKVMQALADSGYPVVGEKFPSWMDPELYKHNPLGFYEVQHPAKAIAAGIGRAAIKVRMRDLPNTPMPRDARFICCVRDVVQATESQMRTGFMAWAHIEDGINANSITMEDMEEGAPLFAHMARHNLDKVPRCLEIWHEKWLEDPEGQKARLLEWAHGA